MQFLQVQFSSEGLALGRFCRRWRDAHIDVKIDDVFLENASTGFHARFMAEGVGPNAVGQLRRFMEDSWHELHSLEYRDDVHTLSGRAIIPAEHDFNPITRRLMPAVGAAMALPWLRYTGDDVLWRAPWHGAKDAQVLEQMHRLGVEVVLGPLDEAAASIWGIMEAEEQKAMEAGQRPTPPREPTS